MTPHRNDLPERFLEEARSALLDGEPRFNPQDVILISADASLRARFIEHVRTHVNDPDLKSVIVDYIEETAESLDGHVDLTDTVVELIDRASFPVATAAVLSGIGLFVSVGVVLGPVAIFMSGLAGLAISGTGQTMLRLRSNRSKATAKKLRRLAAQLRSI